MANALRGMPIATKMDIFEREVRGDNQLFSAPRPYHGTIVANAKPQNSVRPKMSGAFANAGDQFTLAGCL
jgi:hypothetical protein